MRDFFVMNAGDLADALEDWIIDNRCNPVTKEEWARCMTDIQKSSKARYLGSATDKDAEKLKESLLRDFNVKELKDLNNENS